MVNEKNFVDQFKKFDDLLIEDLKNPEYAAGFLNIAIEEFLEDGDIKSFNKILNFIVKASNVSQIAKESKISRNHLYRIINNKSEPTLTNALRLIKALGYQFKIEPIEKSA